MLHFFRRFRRGNNLPKTPVFTTPLSVQTPCILVGDIHGRLDLLDRLLKKEPFTQSEKRGQHIVFVGDYIDRGESSADVLRRLHALDQSEHVTCLMGNHEQMMIEFLDDPRQKGSRWLRNGGLQTLASFGIGGISEGSHGDTLVRAAEALTVALGVTLEGWVRALELSYRNGNLICVHAGLDPHIPISEQTPSTLVWGHSDFLKLPRTDGWWVSHGHTTVDQPTAVDGRIALDTGAYYSGCLSAAILRPEHDIEFINSN